MKRILLTGGPTNEPIDEVMKITNMSTGKLTLQLAQKALDKGCFVCMIINESVTRSDLYERFGYADIPEERMKVVSVETTEDMYHALEAESKTEIPYDVVLHASAVGDYKPQFSFRMEDMAKEIADKVQELTSTRQSSGTGDTLGETDGKAVVQPADTEPGFCEVLESEILKVLTDPLCKVNDDSKISSYEPHLTVKLTLTTKLIANLRNWYPKATLIGFKLLENVSRDHLVDVAKKLCEKNRMDYILANDLAELRKGYSTRHMVTSEGYTGISFNAPDCPNLEDYAAENWFQ